MLGSSSQPCGYRMRTKNLVCRRAEREREMTRVAIIGAGPSGLAALRAFQSARLGGAEIPIGSW
jgi:threonine dehydrogenase-like Zn-dependent dehydrogenase